MNMTHYVRARLENISAYFLCVFWRLIGHLVPLGLAVCGLSATTHVFAFDLQELQVPPETQQSWVGKHIVHNGMPMQIVQLQSSLPIPELLRFYRKEWQNYHKPGERATVSRRMGEWQTLSTLVDGHHVVVQLIRKAGQTEGFLSITPLDTATEKNSIARYFPRQGGAQLLSSTESNDGGVKATTLILQNYNSLRSNQAFYKNALQRSGWNLSRSSLADGTAVMLFDRSSGSLQLAMRRENDTTMIFANVRGEGS